MCKILTTVSLTLLCVALAIPALAAEKPVFVFRDQAQEAGLFPALDGIEGHSAGWGDADGDGWLELYVGTFCRADGKGVPNTLFKNVKGKFQADEQAAPKIRGRINSSLFVDLDNDGDLDMYVSSMPQPKQQLAGCSLLRNDGAGKFTDISKDNGACPPAFGGRSAAAFDFDGDGLLDLLVGEDPIKGYNGSTTTSSRLFRNLGKLAFEDVSATAGLTKDIPGLGVAVGDLNGDGRPDFFLASKGGGNRLFLADGAGKFSEAPGSREIFDWAARPPKPTSEDTPCGVAFGDVNRDGRLDILVGHHYSRPWVDPVANRLYLNRGVVDGKLAFEDVTDAAGLKPLPMKAPHVEVQDFDNDGWPDLLMSLIKFADGVPHPLIYRNLGVRDGLPRFEERAMAVNDFPTAEDKAVSRTGAFFDKMVQERKVLYTAPAPSGDFDNDGRQDIFFASWWAKAPSLLLHNETPGGKWLKVEVRGPAGVNRMGIGSAVRIYPAGKLGDAAALLGHREIAAGYGYTSGQEAVTHFGLGETAAVDIEVILPHGKGKLKRTGVPANQRIVVE